MSCRLQSSSASHGGGFGSGSCQLGGGRRVATCSSRFVSGASAGGYGGGMSCGFGGGYGRGFGKVLGLALVNLVVVMAAPLAGKEKTTMQNLNYCLATYLDKVHALEQATTELEVKIRDSYQKQSRVSPERDYSVSFQTTDELRAKILEDVANDERLILQIDNTRMILADFNFRYETELALGEYVEVNTNGLLSVLNELDMSMSDLRKIMQREMKEFRNQVMGQINVEMDATPSSDLTQVLAEMRARYGALAEKNCRDAEAWFQSQSAELNKEVSSSAAMNQTRQTEITGLRRKLQGPEIELQSQKAGLKGTLAETGCRYAPQLQQIQGLISGMEAQLSELRSEMECQNQEYKILLDIKTRLEQKIATYRSLP